MRTLLGFFKRKDLYLGICRYLLAIGMIPYAITKILRTQFVVLPFSLWQQPLEALSGKNLTWAFLGYSPWFQVLLGFLELIPCLLLLFRRTALLGAILLLPMTASVFLINEALDLWEATQLISGILLLLNLALFLFYWPVIRNVFLTIVQRLQTRRAFMIELVVNLVILSIVGYYATTDLLDYRSQRTVLTGDWLNGHPHEWILQSETQHGKEQASGSMKSYFASFGSYTEVRDTGAVKEAFLQYELDEKNKQLTFMNPKDSSVTRYRYTITDSILRLDRLGDSLQLTRIYKKRVINAKNGR